MEISGIKERLWALPEDRYSRKSLQNNFQSMDIDAKPLEICGHLRKPMKIYKNNRKPLRACDQLARRAETADETEATAQIYRETERH